MRSSRVIPPRTMIFARVCILAAVWVCIAQPGAAWGAERALKAIEPGKVLFWDRTTAESANLLRQMIDEFNVGRTPPLVEAQYTGDYTEIFRKVRASIQAGAVPSMAVAYQSMTVEYARSGAVIPIDALVADPAIGLTAEDQADFFPAVIEMDRLPEFGGKMYSFPFCKSVLMMYYNKRVLAKAGISAPPVTWDEFLDQCRAVKAKTGKYAYAVSVDASTIDGMIFSMGGEVAEGRRTLFDSPETLRVFTLLETLAVEGLAYDIDRATQDDEVALSKDEVAFVLRTSSHRQNILQLMGGDVTRWGLTRIPQADPANPRTVLFGPSICIFATGPDHNRTAWEFIKSFTSRENNVRWALSTGYVPIRKSAAEDPRMQTLWAMWPDNRAAFDCLSFAKTEPAIAGWQEVRGVIEKAETAVLTGFSTAHEAVTQLKKDADAVLAGR